MLQIKNISKEYVTGELHQRALNGVSLNLRDNEFVAILGPSGSGKTTLLNVIGGLDRYDSGDLVINGVSTKKYTDADWDSYRNHTIGFVFQSYNLIPHLSVLQNVELALTISGVSKGERRKRAVEALKKVGLGEQLHKRPNQMSGGQMQRVAIARALVNNPQIVLADEPTGALDTETSVQVMELLKEVAKDRLVVMVTHNPELAEAYATRIVRLRDGSIVDDTDPYVVSDATLPEPRHKNLGKASMSFLTALTLSFNNLKTKKGRTILTAFAGSLGIIGIALILSLSNGVNNYIEGIERDTMGNYPIELEKESINLQSMMDSAQQQGGGGEDDSGTHADDAVYSNNIVGDTVSATRDMVSENNLGAFKAYYDQNGDSLADAVSAVEYGYSITPQVYRLTDGGAEQVSPATLDTGESSAESTPSMSLSSSTSTAWVQLPRDESLRESNYELLAGEWPQGANEAALVVSSDNEVSDFVLYTLGLMDEDHMNEVVEAAENGTQVDDPQQRFDYDQVIGLEYKVLAPYQLYSNEDGVWVDESGNSDFVAEQAANGRTIRITAVLRAGDSADIQSGVAYTGELTDALMLETEQSDVVKAQLADPSTNVLTGEAFDKSDSSEADGDGTKESDQSDGSVSQAAYGGVTGSCSTDSGTGLAVNGGSNSGMTAVQQALYRPSSQAAIRTAANDTPADDQPTTDNPASPRDDTSRVDDPGDSQNPGDNNNGDGSDTGDDPGTGDDPSKQPEEAEKFEVTFKNYDGSVLLPAVEYDAGSAITELPTDDPARPSDATSDYVFIGWKLSTTNGVYTTADLPPVTEDVEYTAFYYASPVKSADHGQSNPSDSGATDSNQTNPGLAGDKGSGLPSGFDAGSSGSSSFSANGATPDMSALMSQYGMGTGTGGTGGSTGTTDLSALASQYGTGTGDFDASALAAQYGTDASGLSGFAASSGTDLTNAQLDVLMAQMSDSTPSTYEDVLDALGYAIPEEPESIKIYPTDFDAKQRVEDFIAAYNDQASEADQVTYTDMVGLMVSSVTSIVNMISYVLIAFVAVSLVVSSIMIGIITYISVLERTKEIGILRALGASKHNVSQVFNAETFIIGLLAGLIGIGATLLLLMPVNAIIHSVTGVSSVNAALPAAAGALLVLLSVALTLVGGLIPARKAAKKDPVLALRSE